MADTYYMNPAGTDEQVFAASDFDEDGVLLLGPEGGDDFDGEGYLDGLEPPARWEP